MVRHEAESPLETLIERMPMMLLLDGHKLAILLHWHWFISGSGCRVGDQRRMIHACGELASGEFVLVD
eukprot:5364398-Pleurochrysis_carterae.AAC.1